MGCVCCLGWHERTDEQETCPLACPASPLAGRRQHLRGGRLAHGSQAQPPSAACQSLCRSEPSPGHRAHQCQRQAPPGNGARNKARVRSLDLQSLPLWVVCRQHLLTSLLRRRACGLVQVAAIGPRGKGPDGLACALPTSLATGACCTPSSLSPQVPCWCVWSQCRGGERWEGMEQGERDCSRAAAECTSLSLCARQVSVGVSSGTAFCGLTNHPKRFEHTGRAPLS